MTQLFKCTEIIAMVPVRPIDLNPRHPGLLAPNLSFPDFLSCLKTCQDGFPAFWNSFLLSNLNWWCIFSKTHYSINIKILISKLGKKGISILKIIYKVLLPVLPRAHSNYCILYFYPRNFTHSTLQGNAGQQRIQHFSHTPLLHLPSLSPHKLNLLQLLKQALPLSLFPVFLRKCL